jgi:hypothetical protein
MPSTKIYAHAFSGGEVSPELYGRQDVAHVAQSVALARNFITLPHGPAQNRAGTEFVKEVRDSTKATRLISFSYNATQTFAVEIGAGYFRWHTLGETLLTGSAPAWSAATTYVVGDLVLSGGATYYCIVGNTNHVPPNATYWYAIPADGTYEVPNPYAEGDLFDIHYTQSADIMTLVHPTYAVRELRRLGATNWQLPLVSFQPQITAPSSVTATATGSGSTSYTYVVTAVAASNNLEESLSSATASCTNDLTTGTNHNTIGWVAPAGALRINVYKLASGLYGYIGQAAPGATFVDTNILPDISRTPPLFDSSFDSGTDLHPGAVGYFEQRRVFAGWGFGPQNVLSTRSGTESNINYHIPTLADDRIAFRIAARQGSQIHHIVPSNDLILLTGTNAFRIFAGDGGALTGANVNSRAQGPGANNVQPVSVDTTVIYAKAVGGRMCELAFATTNQGSYYQAADLSELAPHLFDGFEIVDMAYSNAPFPIVWAITDQGQLLGCTYVPGQRISAWHHHDTDGFFESCCVITEQGEDFLYLIVRRLIGGVWKRYVERLHTRKMATQADAFFVDCGLTYSGAPIPQITDGLDHLKGKTVSILADGAVLPQQVVTDSGGLPDPFPAPASTVQVGLPITADLQTLPLSIALPDGGQGTNKNLNNVWLRVKDSSGLFAGPDFDHLTAFKQRTTEPYGEPPRWVQGWMQVMPLGSWGADGQVCIRQTDPLPVTIVAAKLEVALGG